MELTYDWRSFQSVFYPQKRSLSLPLENQDSAAIFAIVETEKDTVVVAYGENEDLSDFIGTSLSSLKSSHPHREVVCLERETVDQWIQMAVGKVHLHEQISFFRKSASPQLQTKVRNSLKRKTCLAEKHFLLDSLMGNWGKILPSAFGVFIRLEKAPSSYQPSAEMIERFGSRCKEYLEQEQDILILFRGGKLEAFYEPDLSSMGSDRKSLPNEVVRYLSEKHAVPVQGVTALSIEWMSWGQSTHPWRAFARSFKAKKTKLTPFNWKIASLLGIRATFEI
jgi:hypothetical protein